jgi:hypothetical protein
MVPKTWLLKEYFNSGLFYGALGVTVMVVVMVVVTGVVTIVVIVIGTIVVSSETK